MEGPASIGPTCTNRDCEYCQRMIAVTWRRTDLQLSFADFVMQIVDDKLRAVFVGWIECVAAAAGAALRSGIRILVLVVLPIHFDVSIGSRRRRHARIWSLHTVQGLSTQLGAQESKKTNSIRRRPETARRRSRAASTSSSAGRIARPLPRNVGQALVEQRRCHHSQGWTFTFVQEAAQVV